MPDTEKWSKTPEYLTDMNWLSHHITLAQNTFDNTFVKHIFTIDVYYHRIDIKIQTNDNIDNDRLSDFSIHLRHHIVS